MTRYVRLCRGLNDKGMLIKPEELESKIQDYDQDHYVSVYYYNEDQYKQFQTTKTVRGITNVSTDVLAFDFDSKNDLEAARADALKAIDRLKSYKVDPSSIEIYFSGSKGFTVQTKLPKLVTPEQASSIALNKIGKDLQTLDPSLYNASRILRVPGTMHADTGLYKVPLTIDEIKVLSIDGIKALAKESFVTDPAPVSKPSESLFAIEKQKEEVKGKKPKALDLTNKSPQWKEYKWALLQGFFESGERHNAMMVIAATCRGLGYDADTAFHMCKAAAEKQALRTNTEPFDETELRENIIDQSVFSPYWEGGQFSYKNNAWLQAYCVKMDLVPEDENEEEAPLCSLAEIETGFTDYVKNIGANTIYTGIKRLDDAMPLTTGMNLGIVGSASSGKTAIALEILKNTSQAGVVSVFASLDMHRNRLFEKLLYKTSGLTRSEIYEKFKSGKGYELTKKIKEDYGNVYFYDRSCPNVADIRRYIAKVEQETGKRVKLVMVDYFERVNSERSEETAASKDVAGQLQDLINDLNVCLVTLVQPNKFSLSGGPDTPITSYTAIKGSSFLYQSFRSIISIWRPFFTPETKDNDRFMQMAILKNDLGELDMFDFSWEGRTGTISELAEEQYQELQNLLKQKDNKKKAEDGSW